ncbi:unnamed protein product [Medioppia subpectinata]|uniref:Cytochrome P450 n=1 Tax=Medioppia subpectinata TaxID=1979941 RepID=A0A7R9KHS0_9ACAR|nr:unnamed protein product [Medioppia subpectinata]CAG2102535.1 unnamed protein product [Medioppia subpectinata]
MHLGSSKLGQSLFFMPGNDDWKRVRSILSPVFTSGKLRAMMGRIGGIADKLVQILIELEKNGRIGGIADKLVQILIELEKNGKPVDMRNYVGAFTMDVISACGYGIETDSINNPDHPIVINAKRLLASTSKLPTILSVLTPGLARLFHLEPFDKQSKRRTDFIQLILDAENSDKELNSHSDSEPEVDDESVGGVSTIKYNLTLSPDEMVAQGLTFFTAGYDTTSASITNSLYFLSKHPDCQQILYEELRSCDEFTYEKLSQLKYLNAVINETLRLAPSLTRYQRECLQDYKLGNTGITIPKGASVEIYPYALHRDPDFWPNPNDFIPDRFLNPVHHPYAYIPFSSGPRICLGQRFVKQEMRMCLAKLITKLEFSMCNQTILEYLKVVQYCYKHF